MFESKAQENPYPKSEFLNSIRPRPLIYYGGGAIGILVCLPAVILIVMLVTDPAKWINDLDWTSCFIFLMQAGLLWLTFRWFTIKGMITEDQIVFRGWIKTLKIDSDNFHEINKLYYDSYSDSGVSQQKWKYVVYGKDNQILGSVPAAMQFCQHWDRFMKQLNQSLLSNHQNDD